MSVREILERVYRDGLEGELSPEEYDFSKHTSKLKSEVEGLYSIDYTETKDGAWIKKSDILTLLST